MVLVKHDVDESGKEWNTIESRGVNEADIIYLKARADMVL